MIHLFRSRLCNDFNRKIEIDKKINLRNGQLSIVEDQIHVESYQFSLILQKSLKLKKMIYWDPNDSL